MAEADATLDGRLDRFVYQDARTGFGIAILATTDGDQVVKGPLWGLVAGDTVQIRGRWVEHPRYGRQVEVESAVPQLPTTEQGIAAYLASAGVKGLKKGLAQRIVDEFGQRTLQVVREDPEALRVVRGVGPKLIERLEESLAEDLAQTETLVFLNGLGLGPALIRRVVEHYGVDAIRAVQRDPYRLAREVHGVGFSTADRVARGQGVAQSDPRRLEAGVLYALGKLADHGHTAPDAARTIAVAADLLGCDLDEARAAAERTVAQGHVRKVIAHEADGGTTERLSQRALATAEHDLRRDLQRLAESTGAQLSADALNARLDLATGPLGFALEGTQRRAVAAALTAGLLIVTGGPGTGKTTIVQGVLAATAPDDPTVALCAPTGRAARRLSESTLMEASTVHRLLEYNPRDGGFARDRDNPLPADLVIVDESSMLDVKLCAALCGAIRDGARLLLVGDADQLPSVGAGAVLHDIIGSGACPVVRLDRIYRQEGRSRIVDAAHAVLAGELPASSRAGTQGDFFIVPRRDPEAIVQTVLEIVTERLPKLGFDPVHDVQVLVPMHRGDVGTQSLNRALRAVLNPDGEVVADGLRVGDKVLQTRNNYDLDVFNGDVGRILGVVAEGTKVRFGDRVVVYDDRAVGDLRLAYAMTVHKSQGSEHPAIVVPLTGAHHVMLQRNLLYTAITRARRFCVLVGPPSAIARAVHNAAPNRRETLLGHHLRGEIEHDTPHDHLDTPEPDAA